MRVTLALLTHFQEEHWSFLFCVTARCLPSVARLIMHGRLGKTEWRKRHNKTETGEKSHVRVLCLQRLCSRSEERRVGKECRSPEKETQHSTVSLACFRTAWTNPTDPIFKLNSLWITLISGFAQKWPVEMSFRGETFYIFALSKFQ